MIEVINIFLQFFIFVIIFSFPFNTKILNKNLNLIDKNFNFIDTHAINIIFFIYLCLILSLFQIDIRIIFKIYFLISIIYLLFNIKWFFLQTNKIDLTKFFFFFLIIFSIFIFIAQNIRLEWDGHVWIQKAYIFLNNNDISQLNNTIIPDYPHLGSYLWAFFWGNSFLEIEYFGRFFHVYFYIVSIFLIFNCVNIKNDFIKTLLILFVILITFEPYYFAGYQEYLVFSSLVIASRLIYILNINGNKNLKIIFFILLSFYLTTWFKNEGTVYLIIFFGSLLFFLNIENSKKIFFIILAILLLISKYLIQKYLIQNSIVSGTNHLSNLIENLSNFKLFILQLSKIILHILIAFIKHPLWLLSLLAISIKLFFLKKIDFSTKYLIICLMLNLAIIIGIYSSFSNLDYLLRVTLDRVLFQTSGFYLISILMLLNIFNISSKKIK